MNQKSARTWKELVRDREILSWSLYDWANSAFATTVMAGFFPVFFKQYWSAGADVNVSTYQLGNANSLSSAILAFISPVLGAIADQASGKKRLLIGFSFMGIVMTGALSLVAKGDWPLAVILYVIASIGFAGSNALYDALIVLVARPSEVNRVSALGFSLGYLGGGVLFAINVLMTLKPELFGLSGKTQAVQLSFVSVAIWWTTFSIPLIFFVREEKKPRGPTYLSMAAAGFRQVAGTFRELRQLKNVTLFLFAYFFYIDGVNTIIRMAVDYGLSLGFSSESLIVALLLTQFVGFPAALLFGQLAQRIGAKAGLFVAIAAYTGITIFGYFMQTPAHFYLLAMAIGLFQGGIQSLSRSVFAAMTPKEKAGEFFGFFNMLGKFSSMMGPFLVGWVSLTTGSARLSVLSLIILFIIGAIGLLFVRFDSALEVEN